MQTWELAGLLILPGVGLAASVLPAGRFPVARQSAIRIIAFIWICSAGAFAGGWLANPKLPPIEFSLVVPAWHSRIPTTSMQLSFELNAEKTAMLCLIANLVWHSLAKRQPMASQLASFLAGLLCQLSVVAKEIDLTLVFLILAGTAMILLQPTRPTPVGIAVVLRLAFGLMLVFALLSNWRQTTNPRIFFWLTLAIVAIPTAIWPAHGWLTSAARIGSFPLPILLIATFLFWLVKIKTASVLKLDPSAPVEAIPVLLTMIIAASLSGIAESHSSAALTYGLSAATTLTLFNALPQHQIVLPMYLAFLATSSAASKLTNSSSILGLCFAGTLALPDFPIWHTLHLNFPLALAQLVVMLVVPLLLVKAQLPNPESQPHTGDESDNGFSSTERVIDLVSLVGSVPCILLAMQPGGFWQDQR